MSKAAHERYLFKPFIGSSHSWALSQLKSLPKDSKILDIGPGPGTLGKFLIEEQGISDCHAVEIDEKTIPLLKNIYKSVGRSIDAYEGQIFDIILLLDVIEHMTDPESFLKSLKVLTKPGSKILISVPNIAHWSIRLSLLFGIFEYTERGLLDKTHYQFFTKKRVENIAYKLPFLKRTEASSSIAPLELLLAKPFWDNPIFSLVSELRLSAAQALPGLLAFQHLAMFEVQAET